MTKLIAIFRMRVDIAPYLIHETFRARCPVSQ
jgi:hypothetical protein